MWQQFAALLFLCAGPVLGQPAPVCVDDPQDALGRYLAGYREDIQQLYLSRGIAAQTADPLIYSALEPEGFDRAARLLTGLQGRAVLALYHLDQDAICVFGWVSGVPDRTVGTVAGYPLAPSRFFYAQRSVNANRVREVARVAVAAVSGNARGALRAPLRSASVLEEQAPEPAGDAVMAIAAAAEALRFSAMTEALSGTDQMAVHLPAELGFLPVLALPLDGQHPLVETHAVTMVERLTAIVALEGTSALGGLALDTHTRQGTSASYEVPLMLWQPAAAGTALVVADPAVPAEGYLGLRFPPLPGARDEAAAVAEMLGVPVVEGAEATVERVAGSLQDISLFHYAGHGVASADTPLDASFLALADQGLTARMVQGLRLHAAPLVVLSACDTGRGQAAGAGVIGLARAFLRAGAVGTVTSYWPVSDQSAGPLMIDFYRGLATVPPPEALRRAALAARARFPDPADWAAFGYFGAPFVGMAPM